MIYVVLGMHKSGTTLVTRFLDESGISMGEFDPEVGYDQGNKCERVETHDLNRDLLADCLLRPIRPSMRREPGVEGPFQHSLSLVRLGKLRRKSAEEERERMRRIIADCSARHEDWGFKDPRTCLTYPFWEAELPPHKLILVYRSLSQLLDRYHVSGWRSFNLPRLYRALSSWSTYNALALEAIEKGRAPGIVIRFEELMKGDDELDRLRRFVGRQLVDVRDPRLFRNDAEAKRQTRGLARLVAATLRYHPETVFRRLEVARARTAAD